MTRAQIPTEPQLARQGVRFGAAVDVADHGRGTVSGFTSAGRVVVRLARSRHVLVEVIVQRDRVKAVTP